MSAIDTLQSITSRLISATKTAQSEIADLRRRITETRQALGHAQQAPIPRDEIEARIHRHVAQTGAHWIEQRGRSLIRGERALGTPDLRGDVRLPWYPHHPVTWEMVCAAEPDRAVAILMSLVRQVEYQPGPPSAERPALVAQLERELGELEGTEIAAVDAACSAGVTIAHRPEIVARREQEARARELEEQKISNRRARQDALDEAYRQQLAGGRTGRSQYLDGNR